MLRYVVIHQCCYAVRFSENATSFVLLPSSVMLSVVCCVLQTRKAMFFLYMTHHGTVICQV